jgi:ferritin
MIDKKVEELMNAQVTHELHAAHIYLSMSAYLEEINMPGFAAWMRIQYNEEIGHAMRFYRHLIERGGRVKLDAIEAPPVDFASPLDVAEKALAHEKKVTGQINTIFAAAMEACDYASYSLLEWFVDEQVEEELNATTLIEQFKMVGDNKAALFMLDKELGQRQPGAEGGE